MDLLAQATRWRDEDPDPHTRAELDALITVATSGDDGSTAALEELSAAFAGPLQFGTAGLRGPLGPGPARMNRMVVMQAAAGLARWLLEQGRSGNVVIGHDARHGSATFARDTAEVMAGAGLNPVLVDTPTPTPVVAFAISCYEAIAGVVVTASHNPATDNGYKVYLGDGSQIIAPTDSEIASHIAAVASRPIAHIPRGDAITIADTARISSEYLGRAQALVGNSTREVSWVYTPMHGVGGTWAQQVARACGFEAPIVVAEQFAPDPDFPSVPFPNPEEPGAMDLALALARRSNPDVVIANDPDADRCAVAAVIDGSWRMLTGDELGALLGDDAIRKGVAGTYACSVVSSTLLRAMAAANGVAFETTLTGFKWIGRVKDLAFGYEEAIGYCCDPKSVPDKDGLSALATVLRITSELKAQGETISDRLDSIARNYGVYATSQLSVRVDDLSIISDAMSRLREAPPSSLLGSAVVVTDLIDGTDLPPTNAVELSGDRVHVVVRPSGTEPKLKCYLEARQDVGTDLGKARGQAAAMLASLRQEMAEILGL